MSKNRLSLLRAMHNLSRSQKKIQQAQQPKPQQQAMKKNYIVSLIAIGALAYVAYQYRDKPQKQLTRDESKSLQQNDKKSVQQGLELLKAKFKN